MVTFSNHVWTDIELKMAELDRMKHDASRHLHRLNSMKMRYMDWFQHKHQSFLDSIKIIHILAAQLLPKDITTVTHFKKVLELARKFPRNGTPRDSSPDKMDEFLMFWDQLIMLKYENDALYDKICDFCNSIKRLRQPELKTEIDRLHYRLNIIFSEDYSFMNIHNERDNLFTYRVAIHDHKYHGLLSYIPYVLSYCTKICYWTSKLYIEKLKKHS